MAKYAISSSGEASMRQLALDIKCFSLNNLEAGRKLKQATISVEDDLGIYMADILKIIAQTHTAVGHSAESLEALAKKVLQKANDISELVAMGLGEKSSSDECYAAGNVNGGSRPQIAVAEKTPQDIVWSDVEYGNISDKIQISDQNSGILEWDGEKGNSLRTPKDKSGVLFQQLKKFDVEGIPYVNGDVDFSKVVKYEVEFVDAEKLYTDLGKKIKFGDLMTDNAVKSRTQFNKLIRTKWQAMAKQQILGLIKTDEEFANDFSLKTGVNINAINDVKSLNAELRRNGLTLHETTDCKKIQLVPTPIHNAFKHAGGTAEMLERLINGDIHFKVGI